MRKVLVVVRLITMMIDDSVSVKQKLLSEVINLFVIFRERKEE